MYTVLNNNYIHKKSLLYSDLSLKGCPYMLKTYTIKEAARKMNIPQGTIKKWEKELSEFLTIPRTKSGARFYTEQEIELLLEIKQMRSQNLKMGLIREYFNEKILVPEPEETAVSIVSEQRPIPPYNEESREMNMEKFFYAVDTYKQKAIQEVKEEIRNIVQKEIVEEVKKEISKGSLQTVKWLTDSIYKSTEKTMTEIQNLSNTVSKATEEMNQSSKETSKDLLTLSNRIGEASKDSHKDFSTLEKTVLNISRGTSNQIHTLSYQLSKKTDDLNQHLEMTNLDIAELKVELAHSRENNLKDRKQLQNEILQREAEFQNMLTSFREAASAKEKRWWQFW
jgi:DNA-binding transcriptional MerR regulator